MCEVQRKAPFLKSVTKQPPDPAVFIEIEGVKCQALIYTAAEASYASSTPINHINKKPIRTKTKKIKTLTSTNNEQKYKKN